MERNQSSDDHLQRYCLQAGDGSFHTSKNFHPRRGAMKETEIDVIAEIVFCEFYRSIYNSVAERDIWLSARAAWETNPDNFPMVGASMRAAKTILSNEKFAYKLN